MNVNGSAHTYRAEKLDFKIISKIKIAFIVHSYILFYFLIFCIFYINTRIIKNQKQEV